MRQSTKWRHCRLLLPKGWTGSKKEKEKLRRQESGTLPDRRLRNTAAHLRPQKPGRRRMDRTTRSQHNFSLEVSLASWCGRPWNELQRSYSSDSQPQKDENVHSCPAVSALGSSSMLGAKTMPKPCLTRALPPLHRRTWDSTPATSQAKQRSPAAPGGENSLGPV